MKKNKILYTLSALMMACLISFSGISGSYIQVYATSVGIEPGVWNDDVSAWENIERYIGAFCSSMGLFVNPVGTALSQQDFYNFMISDGVSHDVAHGVFCDCDDSTHTTFSGNEHGGGGHVREGITQDENGNVTISDEVADLFHGYICNYLDTESGYWVVETMSPEDIPFEWFDSQFEGDHEALWRNTQQTVRNLDFCFMEIPVNLTYGGPNSIYFYELKSLDLALSSAYTSFVPSLTLECYENGNFYNAGVMYHSSSDFNCKTKLKTSALTSSSFVKTGSYNTGFCMYKESASTGTTTYSGIFTSDGRLVKVFKSKDEFKKYNMQSQPYYATNNWYNYNSADDNSITISADEYNYYTDESSNLYQDIQNNIDNSITNEDNSVTITETYIQNIVNNTYTEINNNIPEYVPDSGGSGDDSGDDSGSIGDDSGSTGDDSSVSDNNAGSGGSGVGDFLSGLTAILDTLLSLVGKVMSIVADFSQSILNLFSGLTTFTDGFSDFLAGAFGFIPAEVWDIIKVGLSLAILAGIIKFFRN